MKIVSVFGSNSHIDDDVVKLSEQIGKLILDIGYSVCTGGRGGVMEAVSKGARQSSNWTGKEIIGILPESEQVAGNQYLDMVIPTGLGLFRNMLVARTGDACISIAGGAGTLSEIAFAWQIGKPIATMSTTGGWSSEMAGRCLDHRRKEPIQDLSNLVEAESWLRKTLDL